MSAPAKLLLQLIVVGVLLGSAVWWFAHQDSPSADQAGAAQASGDNGQPPLPTSRSGAGPSPSASAGEAPGSEALLQGQVEYLQGQLALLQEENAQLLQRLARLEGGDETAGKTIDPQELQTAVAEIRKLAFDPPPQITPIPPAEMQEKLTASFGPDAAESYSLRSRAWAALGLVESGTDILAGALAVRGEAEGTLPDPTEESAILYSYTEDPLDQRSAGTRIMDLANLLQEQHLSPPDPWDPALRLDQQVATLALRRGDAALVRFQHELAQSMTSGQTPAPGGDAEPRRPAYGVPYALREAYMIFPLLAGGEFVKELYESGGWEAVAAAHQSPPRSTAEILHPELFITGPLLPDTPPWEDDLEILGNPPLWDGVAGEVGCLLTPKQQLPESMALQAAEGWRGGRYLVYPGAAGSGDHLVWETRWEDAGDAAEFFKALRKALLNRHELPFPERTGDGSDGQPFATAGAGRHLHLSNPSPKRVLLIDTASADAQSALLERFSS